MLYAEKANAEEVRDIMVRNFSRESHLHTDESGSRIINLLKPGTLRQRAQRLWRQRERRLDSI